MLLDGLANLVETLQARIEAHSAELRKSEALTRYGLVDPLLRELGWDTSDPSMVRVEYPLAKGYAQQGFADYALLRDGAPFVVVEAKSLNTQLGQAAMQALGYCNALGFPYFAVTDGRHWELYETFRPVPLDDKRVMRLDLKGSIAETCLDALSLWRPAADSGGIRTGASPIIGASVPDVQVSRAISEGDNQPLLNGEWQEVSVFSPAAGTRPAAVRFPGGATKSTGNWADFIAEIVGWLQTNGSLTEHNVPIRLGKQKEYVVNTTPEHQNSSYRQVGPWFVRTNYTGGQHAQNARDIIELARLDPADFAVRLQ